MTKKQLTVLFVCSFVGWVIGSGLFALLPIYAARLGADSASIGNYLAAAFLASTVGTLSAGWLSDRFQRRKLFIIAGGLVCAPGTWLMSQVTQFWQLIPLTIIVWFFAGVGISMVTIVAGLFAGESERGKVFGILGLNGNLGALIGGALSGAIVQRWGFAALFVLSAPCWLIQPVAATFLRDSVQPRTPARTAAKPVSTKTSLGSTFYLLALAAIVSGIAGFIAGLGRPLLMDRSGFSPADISSVVAIGGAIALPFPFIIGWLSDRIGRYRLLIACYVLAVAGIATLAISTTLWQFWLSAVLLAIGSVSGTVGIALVSELVPAESLSVGLAQYGSTAWIGAIIGLMGTGYALKIFGTTNTFLVGVFLALLAMGLVVVTQNMRRASMKTVQHSHLPVPVTEYNGDAF
ncbi:MAG: MFS transporter [Aggregatilineales bacterium]